MQDKEKKYIKKRLANKIRESIRIGRRGKKMAGKLDFCITKGGKVLYI
jgi:hypothetical protein